MQSVHSASTIWPQLETWLPDGDLSQISRRSLEDSPTEQGLALDNKRFTFDLKHKVAGIVRNLYNFIFIFKDVSCQKDLSRINSKETRVMSAAHAKPVPINLDRPCSRSSGFLVDELCADRAKAIDIELLQVCSNVSRWPTRRKDGNKSACRSVGRLFEEHPTSAVIDRRQMGATGGRGCGQHAIELSVVILMKQHYRITAPFLRSLVPSSDFIADGAHQTHVALRLANASGFRRECLYGIAH
jgi:hypothetical protein